LKDISAKQKEKREALEAKIAAQEKALEDKEAAAEKLADDLMAKTLARAKAAKEAAKKTKRSCI
jgi:hypothetical protein